MKPDAKLLKALAGLRGNADFKTVMEALKEDELVEVQRCIKGDGVTLNRAQGAAQVLIHIRETYENAPALLSKNPNLT